MVSSTDFKSLFDKYQLEGVHKGISIVKYCQLNGVVYSHFERWYKKYRAGVVLPVELVDQDGLMGEGAPQFATPEIEIVRYEHHTYMPIIFTPWRKNPWLKHRYLKWNVKITYIK